MTGRALFWLGLAWLLIPHQPAGPVHAWRGDCLACARLGQTLDDMLARLRTRDLPRVRAELRAARR